MSKYGFGYVPAGVDERPQVTLEVSLPATRSIKAGFWLMLFGFRSFLTRRPGPSVALFETRRDDWQRGL